MATLTNHSNNIQKVDWDYFDITYLPDSIFQVIECKELLRKLFKKALRQNKKCKYYTRLAELIIKYLGDKQWAKELLQIAENNCIEPLEYIRLGDFVAQHIGDKEWARKIYFQSDLNKYDSIMEFTEFAESISKHLDNKELLVDFYKRAATKIRELNCLRGDALHALADSISKHLPESDWLANELYNESEAFPRISTLSIADNIGLKSSGKEKIHEECLKAFERCDSGSGYQYVADQTIELLCDYHFLKDVFLQILEKPDVGNYGYHLAESVMKHLGDRDLARKFYEKTIETCKSGSGYIVLAAAIIENIGDINWAKQLYKMGMDTPCTYYISLVDSIIRLADSIIISLNDKQWAGELYRTAQSKCDNCDNYIKLANSVATLLEGNQWARSLYLSALEKCDSSYKCIAIGDAFIRNLNDKKFAKRAYESCLKLSKESCINELKILEQLNDSENYMSPRFAFIASCVDVATSSIKYLGDIDYAKKIYLLAQNECSFEKSLYNFLAKSIASNLYDKEWATNLYLEAQSACKNGYNFNTLGDSVYESLGNKQWARELYFKALDAISGEEDITFKDKVIDHSMKKLAELADKEWIVAQI